MVIQMLVDQIFKMTLSLLTGFNSLATANTARVFMTTNFKFAVGRVITAIALTESLLKVFQIVPLAGSILHDLLIAVISHITKIQI